MAILSHRETKTKSIISLEICSDYSFWSYIVRITTFLEAAKFDFTELKLIIRRDNNIINNFLLRTGVRKRHICLKTDVTLQT